MTDNRSQTRKCSVIVVTYFIFMNIIFSSESLVIMLSALAGVLAVNVLLLVLFVVFIWLLLRRIVLSQQEAETYKQEAYAQVRTAIDGANAQAINIVQEATRKGRELIDQLSLLSNTAEKEVHDTLAALSYKQSEELRSAAGTIFKAYQELIANAERTLSDTLKQSVQASSERAAKHADQFQDLLKQELLRYQQAMDTRFNEWHKAAEQEIEQHKKDAIKKVESSIYEIIFFVSTEVLGKALDMERHQDLVIRALEEAKKEGFFA